MRFGVREICDVVLRAKSTQKLGARKFYKNEPVLYFDTLKTSSLEGASTTVYATGGRGNSRLIAWEGERTLTFTMEDALLSMESFSILSGAGLIDAKEQPIYVHQTSQVEVGGDDRSDNLIVLPVEACWNGLANTKDDHYHSAADIFVMTLDNGEVDDEPCIPVEIAYENGQTYLVCYSHKGNLKAGSIVLVDYYVKRVGGASMIEITPDKFGGFYYLEASTLFRREADGVDMPAEFIIPKCKVQSNFTFSMAATGDPSTFTFTMDAFPDYTKFDQTHKVLAAIQIIEEMEEEEEESREACKDEPPYAPPAVPEIRALEDGVTAIYVDPDRFFISGESEWKPTDTATFGSTAKGTDVNVKIPIPDTTVDYTLVQENPALEYYYPDDNRISFEGGVYTKTQTLAGSDMDGNEFQFLVSNKPGKILISLYEGTGVDPKKLVVQYRVFNGVEDKTA